MRSSWVENEVSTTTMPDERLRKRLQILLERLAADSQGSIPTVCNGWSETQAAYRFLSNTTVKPLDIISGHRNATITRIAEQPVVLLAQDTTFIDYGIDVRVGMGFLSIKPTNHYLCHPTVAFTPQRVNLGVVHTEVWQRPEESVRAKCKTKPIEEKESHRWLASYEHACQIQRQCPDTMVISLADREGDIHEWFHDAQHRAPEEKAHLIVRAKSNRRTENEDGETSYLWDELTTGRSQGTLNITTPRRPDRAPRKVSLIVRYKEVCFIGKQRHKKSEVTMYAVCAKEKNPRQGEKGIEWMLLTTLPVENITMAKAIVGWYRARWEIEIYFRVLKQGCRVEALRLETDERIHNAIALYQIVAWRLHLITMASREYGTQSCEIVYSEKEWRTIYLMSKRKKPPKKPLKLKEITRMLAMFGSYLGRKSDGEPGIQSVWTGYQRLTEHIRAIEVHASLN